MTGDAAQPHRRLRVAIPLAAVIAVVVAVAVAVWGLGTLPQFPPVREAPQAPTGTLAYQTPAGGDRCVTVAPVAGGATTTLTCGDFLLHRWTDDGHVEVATEVAAADTGTVGDRDVEFLRITTYDPATGRQSEPPVEADWQSWDEFAPFPETRRAEIGDRLGGVRVVAEGSDGVERTVVDLSVPDGYSLWAVAWSPDEEWLYAEDSAQRILLIDPSGLNEIWVITAPGESPTWYLEGPGSTRPW